MGITVKLVLQMGLGEEKPHSDKAPKLKVLKKIHFKQSSKKQYNSKQMRKKTEKMKKDLMRKKNKTKIKAKTRSRMIRDKMKQF